MWVLILALPAAGLEAAGGSDPEAVAEYIQQQVERHGLPGAAVALIDQGQVVHRQGYGTRGGGQPMTGETPLYIGSVSKSFTALAVMQLVESGQVDLDTPVQDYIPWFEVDDPDSSRTITLRHLLNHTSGLSDRGYIEDLSPHASLEESVRALRDASPEAPPGLVFRYFNPGYQVLGLAVEKVSGLPYADYLEREIFAPLGMESTHAGPGRPTEVAAGYTSLFGLAVARSQPHLEYAVPAGFIVSTSRDMARYVKALANQGNLDGVQVLSPEGVRELYEPGEGTGGVYGLGWTVEERSGETLVYHTGGLATFYSYAAWRPEEGTGVVLMVNQHGLVPHITGLSQMTADLWDFMEGRMPRAGGLSARGAGGILLAVLALTSALGLRGFLGAPGWARRARDMSVLRLRLGIYGRLLGPPATYFILPALLTQVLGGRVTWAGALNLAPDVTLVILTGLVLNLATGLRRLAIYLRDQAR